ncbi:MAG TPA: hypothetical protein VG895_01120 [Patescibacteria group bacterium]|nr:hypothetical protein [Patescibacteria group bacterium]
MSGKFTVVYGAPNTGKSTALKRFADEHKGFVYIKYPLYELEPNGPVIDAVIHKRKEMTAECLQLLCAENRRDFEQALEELLEAGINVIAEDYTLTGIVSGLVEGVPLNTLKHFNKDLRIPDKAFLLVGERFTSGRELEHRFEEGDEKWAKTRELLLSFKDEYHLEIINVTPDIEKTYKAVESAILSS